MLVNITARHCNVPEQVRIEAEEKLQRLHRYEPRVDNASIQFGNDHGDVLVETRVSLAGSHSVIATGSGQNFQTAFDQSFDRVARQLKRRRERVLEHKAPKLSETKGSGETTRS